MASEDQALLTIRDRDGRVWVAAALLSHAYLVRGAEPLTGSTSSVLELQRPIEMLEIKLLED